MIPSFSDSLDFGDFATSYGQGLRKLKKSTGQSGHGTSKFTGLRQFLLAQQIFYRNYDIL